MKRFVLGFLLSAGLSLGIFTHIHAQSGGGVGTQAVYTGPINGGVAVDVIRAAKPALEQYHCCTFGLGYLVSRYQQGELQIAYLGDWDGKAWYRVSYGGGTVIADLVDLL